MLLGSFIQRDLLDELCLTIAPYVVGGLARRIATGPGQVLTRCAAPTSSPTTPATSTRATSGLEPGETTSGWLLWSA